MDTTTKARKQPQKPITLADCYAAVIEDLQTRVMEINRLARELEGVAAMQRELTKNRAR